MQEGDVVELQPRFDEKRKKKITVPKGHVWVEGDNSTCSADSRHFGAVPMALLIGRACWIVRILVMGSLSRAMVDVMTNAGSAVFPPDLMLPPDANRTRRSVAVVVDAGRDTTTQ